MNVLHPIPPTSFSPHQRDASTHNTLSAHQLGNGKMSVRKRKADDDGSDDFMSISPANSPSIAMRHLTRPIKRSRGNEVVGKPLALPRLLETLDAQALRSVLEVICDRHPEIGPELVATAPRPSITATLEVLHGYQQKLHAAMPFGGNPGSDYAYDRVKQHLLALIDALVEFTPHYLPPNESSANTSFTYLDGVTKVVHDLPNWDSQGHQFHKDNAYEEISRAWALVITEAAKKGGGFHLHAAGWDQKLAQHNELSGGRMQSAVAAMDANSLWNGGTAASTSSTSSIRNELLSGRYGANVPVVGW